ncbi:phage tail protein [Falsirhodobacter xinxiangensis]|uniref:phage tail protein n=1 Tax=Falsirhodobacter xinxiangensis TaxID=2530049 RepID=UPI0010AA8E4F|nr:phage tail protein [Rhodobacter xinxiangensis]
MSKVAKVLVGAAAIGFAAFTGGVSLAGLGSFLTTGITGRLLTSVALSALSQALVKPQGQKNPGIRSSSTARGDINPDGFILGRYATAGAAVAPPYTHSRSGHKTPNPYLQYVIHLGGAPGQGLAGLLIDGRTTEILGTEIPWDGSTNFGGANDAAGKRREYGREVRIDGSDTIACWVRFVDGTQTVADGRLVNRYRNHPERPWTSSMIGAGISYAIVTFQLEQPLFSGFPQVQFIVDGIPLYDPRKDSTAGGSGAHRWGQPATYERTENTAVQIYNLLRGISLPGGRVYGGRARAEQLPTSSWFAGMNACDASVALAGGGSEKAWRTSYEISVADEPASVIEELCSAASIQLTEMGGTWKIRVGAPGVPVAWLTDDDIIISQEQTHEQFPGLDKTYNGASISFPDPASGWQAVEAPIHVRADYAAQDQGRELIANLSLPAAPYQAQNQRLARAYVEEERRFRRHVVTLPPDYGVLEPLDALAWSSERNGYEDKIFEVVQTTTDPVTQLVTASLRERDPADYDWEPGFQLPYAPKPPIWTGPVVVEVGDFAVSPLIITDADGVARRPALLLTWDTDDLQDVDGLEWEVRLSGATDPLLRGSITDVMAGRLVIAEGILPNEAYQVRARMVGKAFDNIWSVWLAVVAPNVGLGERDIAQEVFDEMRDIAAQAGIEAVTTLPATGRPNQIVMKLPEGVLYRWDAAAGQWVTTIYAGIPDGAITIAKFAQGIRPAEVLDALPGAPHTKGRLVFLTTDNKLYRNTGTGWTAAVPSADITGTITSAQIEGLAASKVTGQLTNDQIAAVAAAKLTGQITGTQITDGAVTTAKVAAGAIETEKLAAGSVIADKIASNAVTAVKIQAGSVETAKLAAGAVEADKIASGAVTTAKLDALAVTTEKLAANSVTVGKIQAGAVGADQIAANAITAKQLLVMDFTNLILDPDYSAENSGYWNLLGTTSGISRQPTPSNMQRPTAVVIADTITAGTGVRVQPSTPIPVNPGEQWYVSAVVRATGTTPYATMALIAYWYSTPSVGGPTASSSPDKVYGSVSPQPLDHTFTVPEGAAYVSFGYVRRSTSGQSGGVFMNQMSARRVNGAVLIENGAVTADKISAGAVTTDALAATAVIASKIAAGAVTTDKLLANAVTAVKIDTDAIEARHIKAKQVTADAMAANSITAANGAIADLSVDTLQIRGNAVTVSAYGEIPDRVTFSSGSGRLFGVSATINRSVGHSSQILISAFTTAAPNATMIMYLYRNSTLIKQWGSGGGHAVRIAVDDDAGSGLTNYQIQFQAFYSGGGGGTPEFSSTFSERFISVTQFKR